MRLLLERAAASPQPPPGAKRAGVVPSFHLGGGGGGGAGSRSPQGDAWDLRWSALSAGRAALRGVLLCWGSL